MPPADASAASLLLHCSYPVCACLHETNPRSVADLSGKRDAFMAQLLSMLSGPSGQDIKDEVGGSFCTKHGVLYLGSCAVHTRGNRPVEPHVVIVCRSLHMHSTSVCPLCLQAASTMGDAFLVFSRSKAEGTPAAAACADPSDDQVGGRVGRHSAMRVCSCCQVPSRPTGAPSGLYDAPWLPPPAHPHAGPRLLGAVQGGAAPGGGGATLGGGMQGRAVQSCLGSVREEKE